MQRRVVLVRHAKTEQGFPDLERVLTGRGRRDAAEIGRWLEAQRIAPDLVVVSPATRAKQTWELAAAELDGDPPTEVDDRVYTNSVEALLEIVRSTDESVETLVLVGHNPSLEQMAGSDFPTASVAVFAVTGSWAESELEEPTMLTTCRG